MTGLSASGRNALFHASCISVDDRGLLILGPSGSGKSALALHLIAMGASLVSDDQTEVALTDQGLVARCPSDAINGLIEARGMGILRVGCAAPAPLVLVADLGRDETDRLPPWHRITILGESLPLVLRLQNPHFPAALMLYLKGQRQD